MNKKWVLLFLLYNLLVFLLFTYLLFPAEMLNRKVERELSKHFSGEVIINDISFNLPASLKMNGLQLTFLEGSKGKKPLSMNIEEIQTGLDFFKILQGKLGIKGKLLIGNGVIKAHIDQKIFGSPVRHFSGTIENISIQDFSFLGQQLGMHITGLLNGEIAAEWSGKDIIKSDGFWSFIIEKGKITPKQFPAFGFDSINSKGLIEKQNIQITRLEVQGPDLSLTATGQIRLSSQIKKFFFDTQVGLKLLPKFRQRLGGFASFLPKPDNKGFINLFVSGPPGDLRFSSRKRIN